MFPELDFRVYQVMCSILDDIESLLSFDIE